MPRSGTVTSIIDHGTIVAVYLDDSPDPVLFDHRCFGHLWEAEGPLVGRRVTVTGDLFEQTISFDAYEEDEE